MSFIFAILFFILFLGLFIILSVLGFLRSLFSFGRHKQPTQDSHSQNAEQPKGKSKIFDKSEGEYVDYEDVKE
ncbi:MAG: DUF4834 family protein [Bacteroidota bacterium]|nr:DUF4834 family protein [Bacteroidota bacterium]